MENTEKPQPSLPGEPDPLEREHLAKPSKGGPRWEYLLYGSFFKLRGVLMVPLILAMVFTPEWGYGNSVFAFSLGILLFVAAFVLRTRSQQYLQYRLRTASGLAVGGPYTYIRNPVYIANMMMFVSICILCRLYWLAPLAILWPALVYSLSIRFEEKRLTKRFGDAYIHYCETVPRWVPRGGRSSGSQQERASLWQALQAEWHIPLLLLVPLVRYWLLDQENSKTSPTARALTFAGSHRVLLGGALIICIAVFLVGRLAYLRSLVGNTKDKAADQT